jgi:hypothetical protein
MGRSLERQAGNAELVERRDGLVRPVGALLAGPGPANGVQHGRRAAGVPGVLLAQVGCELGGDPVEGVPLVPGTPVAVQVYAL